MVRCRTRPTGTAAAGSTRSAVKTRLDCGALCHRWTETGGEQRQNASANLPRESRDQSGRDQRNLSCWPHYASVYAL